MAGGTTSQRTGSGEHYDLTQGIIDNPDPEKFNSKSFDTRR